LSTLVEKGKGMRVSKAEAANNRERIIEVAARMFRELGFEGIGVADLMKSAGLTHGGFYGHFASKEDLMAQACERALNDSLEALKALSESGGQKALNAIASAYLSPLHRDQPGAGCVLAALGAEAPRHGSAVRAAFTRGVQNAIDVLGRLMQAKSKRAKRQRAMAIYASMIGAIILCRAVDDPELSDELLQSVLTSIRHFNSNT
jgi:TetR/AcrR family transcriptional repressor of nem operon